METIPKVDCENIGFIRKTHGVQGDVVLEYETQFELSIEEADRFFIEMDGLLVPFFLSEDGFRYKSTKTAILTFEDVNSEQYAKRLVNNGVYLFKHEIVFDEDQFSISLLESYILIDEKIGEIGVIDEVNDYSGNIVFTLQYKNEERLIPFNENFLIEIDENKKTVKLKLPEGLLD